MEAILIDATVYTLMGRYRQNLTYHQLLFIRTTDKLCVCKCTENQIVADLKLSAFCINHENRQTLFSNRQI